MSVATISEAQFETEVMASQLPVLVEFMTTRSQACSQMAPELDLLATELADKAKILRVDIGESPRLAQMLRIQSVPTYVAFAGGRPVAAEQGALPRQRLRQVLEPFLPRAKGALTAPELSQLLAQRQVVAIDTRDSGSYGRAHIPAAINIPLEEIEGRLAELHMHGQPVLYCRTGALTKELCEKLSSDGVEIPFVEGGFLG